MCVSLSLSICVSCLILVHRRVTSWKHVCILCQCGAHFLLLLKPSRVGHLDMASLAGCRFIHNLFQSGVQLGVMHTDFCVDGGSGCCPWPVLANRGIGNNLCRDLIQNLRLGFFSPQESQLPPAWRWLRHDEWMVGPLRDWAEGKKDKKQG